MASSRNFVIVSCFFFKKIFELWFTHTIESSLLTWVNTIKCIVRTVDYYTLYTVYRHCNVIVYSHCVYYNQIVFYIKFKVTKASLNYIKYQFNFLYFLNFGPKILGHFKVNKTSTFFLRRSSIIERWKNCTLLTKQLYVYFNNSLIQILSLNNFIRL